MNVAQFGKWDHLVRKECCTLLEPVIAGSELSVCGFVQLVEQAVGVAEVEAFAGQTAEFVEIAEIEIGALFEVFGVDRG